jgi:probable phosphoglycerate mutase
MTTVLLIRHASCEPIGRWLAGRRPGIHLDEIGRAEARSLARALSGVQLAAIVSSPLERAVETVEPLAELHSLPITPDADLLEVDFGEWTGCTLAALETDPRWRRFNEARSVAGIPGGERMLDVQRRAVACLERWRLRAGDGTIAICSHADLLRALVVHYLGMPLDFVHRIEIPPASVTTVDLWETAARVRALSWTPSGSL